MNNRVLRLEREWNQLLEKKREEIARAATEEYPVGCRVRWVYTYKHKTGSMDSTPVYREGEVVEVGRYELKAKMHTGSVHTVRFPDAERVA